MKKLLAITFLSALMLTAFVGCNGAKDATSTVSQAASDVVSGAGEVVDKAGDGLNKAGSAVDENADKMKNNGQVSDGDGIIGNEGSTVEGEVKDNSENSDVQTTTESVSDKLM